MWSSGSIHKDCGIIIPTLALRDGGASYHYAEPADTIGINPKYKEEFKEVLKEFGYPYVEELHGQQMLATGKQE